MEPVTSLSSFSPAVPVLLAFFIATVCSMGGISGAFLLLPAQILLLGQSGPGVSATNHLFNVLATPTGVLRYIGEGRMLWPLALLLCAGTLPGLVLGVCLRVHYLPGQRSFSLFAAAVLSFLACSMLLRRAKSKKLAEKTYRTQQISFSARRFVFIHDDVTCTVSVPFLLGLALVAGITGGAYGIGGGAIITPFLVVCTELPIYFLSGATLLATFCTSALALPLYIFAGPLTGVAGQTLPNPVLGLLLGAGGMAGMYFGASLQKRVCALTLQRLVAILTMAAACAMLARAL